MSKYKVGGNPTFYSMAMVMKLQGLVGPTDGYKNDDRTFHSWRKHPKYNAVY